MKPRLHIVLFCLIALTACANQAVPAAAPPLAASATFPPTLAPTATPSATHTPTATATPALPNPPNILTGQEPELYGKIVITIDDCNNLEVTRAMFEKLIEKQVPAVFFPNTESLKNLETVHGEEVAALWKEMYASELIEIGYHTTDHEAYKTPQQLDLDLQEFETYMAVLVGDDDFHINVVRPPYGAWDHNWLSWSAQRHLPTVRWNGSSANTVDYLMAILHRSDGGGITILHTRYPDKAWLEKNIDELIERIGRQNIILFRDVYSYSTSP